MGHFCLRWSSPSSLLSSLSHGISANIVRGFFFLGNFVLSCGSFFLALGHVMTLGNPVFCYIIDRDTPVHVRNRILHAPPFTPYLQQVLTRRF